MFVLLSSFIPFSISCISVGWLVYPFKPTFSQAHTLTNCRSNPFLFHIFLSLSRSLFWRIHHLISWLKPHILILSSHYGSYHSTIYSPSTISFVFRLFEFFCWQKGIRKTLYVFKQDIYFLLIFSYDKKEIYFKLCRCLFLAKFKEYGHPFVSIEFDR